jgi:RHS repeat-associated protein
MPASQQFITRPPVEIFGQYPGYGFAGLGVSTAIGNFTQTAFDLPFPGSLLGLLDWQRTYNSHSGAIGALGPGWTTSFSASLVVTPAQGGLLHHTAASVTFHDEDGRMLTFAPDGAGGFSSPQDLLATLTQNPDGSFTLTFSSGEAWSFSPTGQLTGRSREGQQVTLDYDTQGLLASAAHSFGRYLTFSYDANRRLISVAADDGRTASFAYSAGTVTDSLLQTVTVPGGGVFSFESSGSGQASQVSQITDPDGDLIVANSYDSQTTRVTSQQFASNASVAFSYADTSGLATVTFSPSGAEASFQADANGRLVKVTGPGQNTATFSFSASGYLTEATTPGGTQLTQAHDANGNLLSSNFGGATSSWTYDDQNRITLAADPLGDTMSYSYVGQSHVPSGITDAAGGHTSQTVVNGLVTASTDPEGSTTAYGFDSRGDLVSVTDAAGQVTSFGHDAAGNRTQLTLPSGATSSWAFNQLGQVTSYTDANGGQEAFQYSAAGRLVQQTDQTGAAVRYGYDSAGNQTTVTDPLGETYTYGFDADGNLASFTDPVNAVTQYGYDVFGQLTSITDPVGAVTAYGYDADGNCITLQDPTGTWTTSYDARGNPVSASDPVGVTTHYTYDLADQLTEITDPEGDTWQISHDPVGMPVAVTDAAGTTAKAAWTADGRLASLTDQLGRKTTLARDTLGRVTTVTDAGGGTTQFAYDPDGRQISVNSPAGLTVLREYDAAGREVATVDPRGWITCSDYDARGQLIAQTSASGVTIRNRYDAAGRLTVAIDGDGNETQYGYDAAGRLSSITNALGAVVRFGYDAAGHLTSETDPLGQTTQLAYDAAGNMVSLTDPSGLAQHFSYDVHGRLLTRIAEDGTQVSYTYDNLGQCTSMTDATGTTHYAYDANGNLISVTEPDGAVFTAQYDQAGQRTSLNYPDGLQVTYRYNAKGQLVGLSDSRAGDAAYALDPDGRLITEELPGRLARRYHYEHGLLHRFTVWRDGVPAASTELAYDPDARVISRREDGRLREYRYDRLGQLVSAYQTERDRELLHFTYDAVGNRTALRHGDRHIHYRYDAASQLVAAEADGRRAEYRYDTSGRLTGRFAGDDHMVIDYDGFGRPVTVTTTRGPLVQRQTSTFSGDGLTTMLVLANTDDEREEERTASVRYQWSLDRVPQILAQQAEPTLDDSQREHPDELSAAFSYGYGRVFASHQRGAEAFHHDVFGSTVRTDRTAAWAQAAAYQVFGAPEPGPRPEPQERRGGARDHELRAPELPRFGYLGELALGPVIDLRARSYDADLGRFTTRDPVGPQSAGPGNAGNPYAYAGNDPLDRSDPLGLLAVPLPGGYVGNAAVLPRVVAPAAGQRANSTSSIHLTAEIDADSRGGNNTALHTLAVATATLAFSIQLAAPPTSFYIEVVVPQAGKFRQKGPGSVDLAHISGTLAQLWEVKKDSAYGSVVNTNRRTAGETRNYVSNWNKYGTQVSLTNTAQRFPGTKAQPGPGLAAAAPMPVFGQPSVSQWYVYSLNPILPEGAVLYGEKRSTGRNPSWWWWFSLFSLLGIQKAQAQKGSAQPVGKGLPVGQGSKLTPLLPLSPGTVPAQGALWPFLNPAYTSVYGFEPVSVAPPILPIPTTASPYPWLYPDLSGS